MADACGVAVVLHKLEGIGVKAKHIQVQMEAEIMIHCNWHVSGLGVQEV